MVLEGYYGASDADQAVETIRHALDAGLTMIDSADAYGNGHNELLVGRAVKGRRDDAFIATKFGIVFDEQETGAELPTGWGSRSRSMARRRMFGKHWMAVSIVWALTSSIYGMPTMWTL